MIDMIALRYFGNKERTLKMWVILLAFSTALFAAISLFGIHRLNQARGAAAYWENYAVTNSVLQIAR